MNLLNCIKFAQAIAPAVIKDDAAWTSNVLDRNELLPSDARGVLFVVSVGSIDAAMAALIVKQSDTETNATTLGGTITTVHDVVTKPTADDDNSIVLIYVPLSAWTDRYLQLQATAGDGAAGTYMSAIAIVDRPGTNDLTAAGLNVGNVEIAS